MQHRGPKTSVGCERSEHMEITEISTTVKLTKQDRNDDYIGIEKSMTATLDPEDDPEEAHTRLYKQVKDQVVADHLRHEAELDADSDEMADLDAAMLGDGG